MIKWKQSANPSCILCNDPMETRDHLFFECSYSRRVWEALAGGLLLDKFTTRLIEIRKIMAEKEIDKTKRFLIRYVFQNTLHSIWRERNSRKHGENPSIPEKLVRMIDKNIRNRMSAISREGDERYGGGLLLYRDEISDRISM